MKNNQRMTKKPFHLLNKNCGVLNEVSPLISQVILFSLTSFWSQCYSRKRLAVRCSSDTPSSSLLASALYVQVCENNSHREVMQRDEAKLFFLKYSSAQVGEWQLPPSSPHQGQRDQVICSSAWNALSWTNILKVSSWTLCFLYNSARQKELKVEEGLPPPDLYHDFCICHCSYKVFWGTRICGVIAVSFGFNRTFTRIFHRSCDRDFPSIQFNSTTLFMPEGQFKQCRSSTHPRT